MREIIFDTETTGLSPKDGHRIIEIGAVEMVNKYRTGKTYHVYVNPQVEISPGAMKVHGITNEFLLDKPIFENIADEFLEFIKDATLVAHNAQFDMGFLNDHLNKLKKPSISDDYVVDTLKIARQKYPGQRNTLDALCARLNVDSSDRILHGALLDAELLADVYAEMMGAGANQRNLMYALDQTTEEEEETNDTPVIHFGDKSKTYEARSFVLTEEEELAHNEFMKKIGNSYWNS